MGVKGEGKRGKGGLPSIEKWGRRLSLGHVIRKGKRNRCKGTQRSCRFYLNLTELLPGKGLRGVRDGFGNTRTLYCWRFVRKKGDRFCVHDNPGKPKVKE